MSDGSRIVTPYESRHPARVEYDEWHILVPKDIAGQVMAGLDEVNGARRLAIPYQPPVGISDFVTALLVQALKQAAADAAARAAERTEEPDAS